MTEDQLTTERHTATQPSEAPAANDYMDRAGPQTRLAFEWSLDAVDGRPPVELQTLMPRTESPLPADSSVDMAALDLLRSAGIHLDQEATTDGSRRQLLLTGSATTDELATSIAAFMRSSQSALAVDALASPIRIYEVSSVSTPILAMSFESTGARQVPPEQVLIADVLRRALGNQTGQAARPELGPSIGSGANGSGDATHRYAPDTQSDSAHSDEMVMQEPERRYRVMPEDQVESTTASRWLSPLTTPISLIRDYLLRPRIGPGVALLSLISAGAIGRRRGSTRRWLKIGAAVSTIATGADLVRFGLRRRQQRQEAEQAVQEQLDAERVALERDGAPPTAAG